MKKFLLALTLFLPLAGWAVKYPSMVFTTVQGEKFSISSTNLSIKIEDNKIVASNTEDIMTFDSAALASMEFSTETTTVVDNLATENSPLKLYTLDGVFAGEFCCLESARDVLDGGIYVAVMKNGSSIKINIKK